MPSKTNITPKAKVSYYNDDLSAKADIKPLDAGAYLNWYPTQNGEYGPTQSSIMIEGKGWLVYDLQKEYTLNSAKYALWHDHVFSNIVIKVANKEDFSDAQEVYTLASLTHVSGNIYDAAFTQEISGRYVMLYAIDDTSAGNDSRYTEFEVFIA